MKKNLPEESDHKLDKKEKKTESSTRRISHKKRQEQPQGRYWGIVFLLFTVLISLVFRFFS